MRYRLLVSILLCSIVLQGCTYEEKRTEFSLMYYQSCDSIEELFWENVDSLIAITELLNTKEQFFWENNNSIVPGKKYDYSEHFSEKEWEEIQKFIAFTGLYGIAYEQVWIDIDTPMESCGKMNIFHFSMENRYMLCSLVRLSPSTNEKMADEMIRRWFEVHQRNCVVEMKELGEGWFLFTENYLINN